MSGYINLNDLVASGMVNIAGWGPTGSPNLVTAGQHRGMDELDALDRMGVAGALPTNPAVQNAIAQRVVDSGLIVQREQPTKAREFPLGFESPTPVAAGGTLSITSRPQIPFRGERLVVPSDIAGSFSILDLRVGKNSQFVSSGAVPARTFQENSVGIRLQLDTAQVSQDVTLNVQNIGGADQVFRAAIVGAAVE